MNVLNVPLFAQEIQRNSCDGIRVSADNAVFGDMSPILEHILNVLPGERQSELAEDAAEKPAMFSGCARWE